MFKFTLQKKLTFFLYFKTNSLKYSVIANILEERQKKKEGEGKTPPSI